MFKSVLLALILALVNIPCYATDATTEHDKEVKSTTDYSPEASAKYQKIIDEYKAYLARVKPEIREEIKHFRTEIAKLNKQKSDKYKTLSQEAQNYLAEERKFKKRLPKTEHSHMLDKQAKDSAK